MDELMYIYYNNKIDTNKAKKERYLIRQDNAIYIYTFFIKFSFSSIGQDIKTKLLILIEMSYYNNI